jgi:DNA-directed RNA polymerase specialized sigma24 family protein
MDARRISNEVLRDLVSEYQRTQDDEMFKKILTKTHLLILHVVHQLRHHYKHLRNEALDSLYHTGAVGIYKATFRIPTKEDPEKIPAWLVSYIKNEILQAFPHPRVINASELEEIWVPPEEGLCQENTSECLDGVFKRMLNDNVISQEELELIILHQIQKLPLNEIAAMRGLCSDTISSRIHDSLLRIKHRIRMLNLEPGDCIE